MYTWTVLYRLYIWYSNFNNLGQCYTDYIYGTFLVQINISDIIFYVF